MWVNLHMRRIFSIKRPLMTRTAIKANDPNDPTWKQIMSGEPAQRGSTFPKRPSDEESDEFDNGGDGIPTAQGLGDRFPSETRDIYHFIITYSPPRSLTKHLPFFLESNGDATAISVEQIGGDMDMVGVSVRPHDGSKDTAYQAVERVMVDDLGLKIENMEE